MKPPFTPADAPGLPRLVLAAGGGWRRGRIRSVGLLLGLLPLLIPVGMVVWWLGWREEPAAEAQATEALYLGDPSAAPATTTTGGAAPAPALQPWARAELSDAAAVVQAHYAALGGKEALDQLRSLQIQGVLHQGDLTRPFTMFKKHPHFLRINFELENTTLVIGFDGKTPWQAHIRDGEVLVADEMDAESARLILYDARLHNLLYDYHSAGYTLGPLQEVEFQGNACFQVDLLNNGELKIAFFLDRTTLLERGNRLEVTEDDGTVSQLETRLSDYRRVGPYAFPFGVATFRDGVSVSTLEIDAIRTNVGVLRESFDSTRFLSAPSARPSPSP